MSPFRILSAFALSAILVVAARAQTEPIKVDVESLDSDGKTVTIKGELESVDAKEITVKTPGGVQKIAIDKVLGVTTNRPIKAAPKQYAQVELTDGTALRCDSVDLKN